MDKGILKTSNSAGPCTGRLRAELWDKLHFILGQTTDRMIRGEFWYEGLLETDLLRQAIQHITQAHPILHSAFRDKALRPYWEIMPYTIDDILTVIDADALTEQTEHELRIKAEEHGAEVEAESDRINRPAVGDVTMRATGRPPEQIRYDFMNQVIPVDHNVQYKVALINHRGNPAVRAGQPHGYGRERRL